jgi:hypothetical protein
MNTISDLAPYAIAAMLLVAALAAGFRLYRDLRTNPALRERERRLTVNREGRTTEATITEARDNLLFYSYSVRGVQYTASQDVSALLQVLPAEPAGLVGPATLKYSPENPANSILVCEHWSGLQRVRTASS